MVHAESILLYFVGADDTNQVVLLQKLVQRYFAVRVGNATAVVAHPRAFLLASLIRDGVCPQQVTLETLGWRLLIAINPVDYFQIANVWRDASVAAEEVSVDYCGQREGVKTHHELFLGFIIEFILTFRQKVE